VELWNFLIKLLKIRAVANVHATNIYEIMLPYCKGELFAFVMQAISNQEQFDSFHAKMLRQFVPSRQLRQLRMERYERVQAEGESLAAYVQAVKDAAAVLRIDEGEKLMVERIVEGLSPTQRARFVFQVPPVCLTELEQLVVLDRNIAYADSVRTRQPAAVTVGMVDIPQQSQTALPSQRPPQRLGRTGGRTTCFYCHKTGHIKANVINGRLSYAGGHRPRLIITPG
jgi:hypothetical protein